MTPEQKAKLQAAAADLMKSYDGLRVLVGSLPTVDSFALAAVLGEIALAMARLRAAQLVLIKGRGKDFN